MNGLNNPKESVPDEPAFDLSRAASLRTQTWNWYQRQMKLTARMLYGYMLAVLVIAFVAMNGFLYSGSDLKLTLIYAIIFLIMIEATVLIKLWYWIANNKLSVLREIKLMRVDMAALSNQTIPPEQQVEQSAASPFRVDGLSRIERWIWLILLLVVALAIGARMSEYMARQGTGAPPATVRISSAK